MDKPRDELEAMTKDELVTYAESRDIDVNQNWLKPEIISTILKGQKAAAAKPDSIKHHEDRTAKIQAENVKQQQVEQVEVNRVAENQEIANFKGLPQDGETREQLLERIRRMRDEKPVPVEPEPFRSEGLQKEFEAEQKAGQEAVLKAKEEMERNREAWQKIEAEGEKKERPHGSGPPSKPFYG
jgi:hypothetical protein